MLAEIRHLRHQKRRTVDARENSLWGTRGEILSADYNHHTKICYNAVLMV